MYKIGDILILVKDINMSNHFTSEKYTFNEKYKIFYIKEKYYYIENNKIKNVIEHLNNDTVSTFDEKQKTIKKECSIWLKCDIDKYFINIKEQRNNKIIEILKYNAE